MAPDSSPLPFRRSNVRTGASTPSRAFIPIDDEDELADDTIPCSPGAVLRHDDTTQPTQVLSRPTLQSSSPPSVVEVPASSPFQPSKRPSPKFGSRIAPAGTLFRPPPAQNIAKKRPATEPIDLISDNEDDLVPSRGNIVPTDFRAKVASYSYQKKGDGDSAATWVDDRDMRLKLKQVYDVYGSRYSAELMRTALRKADLDVERAIDWLEGTHQKSSKTAKAPAPAPAPAKPSGRRLVSKATLQANRQQSSPLPPPQAAIKKPKQSQTKKARTSAPERPAFELPDDDSDLMIVIDEERDEAYNARRSPTPNNESDSKVLDYLNSSTLQELTAMTGQPEAKLQPLIDARPFKNLDQARQVVAPRKAGVKRGQRLNIGENAVEAMDYFLSAIEAIDTVVADCEKKAATVKEVMDTWDVNRFGHNKRSTRNTPVPDLPLTPTSLSETKLCKPPIPKQPAFMDGHCEMKPFQLFGLNWMSLLHSYDIGCILADDMGLGKTCQIISFMCHLVEDFESKGNKGKDEDRPWPNLIVVPPSTYNNWLAEFERFAPQLSVVGFRGKQLERMEIAYQVEQAPQDYHVIVGTYSQIHSDSDIESLNSLNLHAGIFDEGHTVKNPEAKMYKDLRRINTDWKMLLTGTPVQNNLMEMTALLSFINPQIFQGHMESIKYMFSQKVSARDISNGAFLYSERVKRARTILEPFILQRRKEQVLSDLPPKVNNIVHCDMTDSQKPVYDEYEAVFKMERSQRALRQHTSTRHNDQNHPWLQMRKAAIHPLLFRHHFTDSKAEEMGKILMHSLPQSELHQPNLEHLVQELKNSSDFELHLWCRDYPKLLGKFDYPDGTELDSGKVQKLLALIRQYQENGDRVLVFSKFSMVLDLLREVMALENIEYRALAGQTAVAERQVMIDEYNEDPSITVFLLTTGAGGTGINLTSANKVIIFDQSDNPQDDIQAENRAHRLGQKRDVEVIRLISNNTVEELLLKACQKKIELANKVTGAVEVDEKDEAKSMEHEVRKMMEQGMTPP